MKTIYYPQDDILEICLSDKPIAREVSQDWNVSVSYAEDGSVVELVILDAVKVGFMPFQSRRRIRIARSRTARSAVSLSLADCFVFSNPGRSRVRIGTPSRSTVTACGARVS
jgi:Protein of unknown function (DUF2283)